MNLSFCDDGTKIVVDNGEWIEAVYYEDEIAYKHLKYYMNLAIRLQQANPNSIKMDVKSDSQD